MHDTIDAAARAATFAALLSLEEKATLCSGADHWHIAGIARLGLSPVCVTDGPHGVRQASGAGLHKSAPATCFPLACATACSFDHALLARMGTALAHECIAHRVGVLLGPAINLKRSPLCGRNFEYFSEDPHLAGQCAAAIIRGVEQCGIGTSVKHFAGNNQEAARMVSDSCIDERALRELYLAAFETAVREGKPATIMGSYNRLNGTYACESRRLLTTILRDEWGFDGLVLTDWGAMHDALAALRAGLDLQMPGPCPGEAAQIVAAVRDGRLEAACLEAAVQRVLRVLVRGQGDARHQTDARGASIEDRTQTNEHHSLAGSIAEQSAVLVQNSGVLPFSPKDKILAVGEFFTAPRYQGAGSSQIVPTRVTSARDAFVAAGVRFSYAQGFACEALSPDAAQQNAALLAARTADCAAVCVFAGLPESWECEGFDRDHLHLPESQLSLIDALCATGKPVVVVLHCGGCVQTPFAPKAAAILVLHLGGQNVGTAAQRLLYGAANPSGKLAETWPMHLADCASTAFFGARQVQYRESLYIGYRWFDKAQLAVRWPFGHGLSYTTFAYSDLALTPHGAPSVPPIVPSAAAAFSMDCPTRVNDTNSARTASDPNASIAHLNTCLDDTLTVSFTLTNTGACAGSEAAQVYVNAPQAALFMPVRELRAFEKVCLQPGESRRVSIPLSARAFSYYNVPAGQWHAQTGVYTVCVGTSSRDLLLCAQVHITGDASIAVPDLRSAAHAYYTPKLGAFDGAKGKAAFEALLGAPLPCPTPSLPYTRNSAVRDLHSTWLGRRILWMVRMIGSRQLASGASGSGAGGAVNLPKMLDGMLYDMPLRSLSMISQRFVTPTRIDGLVDILNGQLARGICALLRG